jgi:ubiquinone/menaquinone biosynthesis C-methylase UbiE
MAGVVDRVQIKDGDARRLPFDDNIFDIVVSSKALHNIFKRAEREKAINEIARVLKPGGWLAIIDSLKYATTLRQMGWQNAKASNLRFRMFPPVRWTTGTKPASN